MTGLETYRIIFIPDDATQNSSQLYAKELSQLGQHYYHVDEKKYFAHITVYFAQFPKNNVDDIFTKLEQIAKATKPFQIRFNNFFSEHGWVGLNYHRNKSIVNTHVEIVNKLNPLRNGFIREKYNDQIKNGKYKDKELSNILSYGYQNVMDLYEPHISLLRFKNEELGKKIANTYNGKGIHFDNCLINKISVAQGGDHGTVTDFVKTYKLSS